MGFNASFWVTFDCGAGGRVAVSDEDAGDESSDQGEGRGANLRDGLHRGGH